MASNKRAVALAAAKQKKQKMIAVGGFVVLLAVLAFSVPKTLKMLKGPQPVEPTPTETAPTPAPTAPATPSPTPAAQPAVATGELVDTGSLPEPSEGQFISFERFASKDPFAQQVGALTEAAATPPAAEVEIESEKREGTREETRAETPSTPSTPSTPASPSAPTPAPEAPDAEPSEPESAPAPKPTSAVITVNGTRETVKVGAPFPATEEIFELVALTPTGAKIGIAGGSLTGGAETVTIEKGKKVTLMNTADGTQYELVLISLS